MDISHGSVLCGGHRPCDALWGVYAGVEKVWWLGDQAEAAEVSFFDDITAHTITGCCFPFRYLKKNVWVDFFNKLLNVPKDLPNLLELKEAIDNEVYAMDSELQKHIRTLTNLLFKR